MRIAELTFSCANISAMIEECSSTSLAEDA